MSWPPLDMRRTEEDRKVARKVLARFPDSLTRVPASIEIDIPRRAHLAPTPIQRRNAAVTIGSYVLYAKFWGDA